MKKIKYYIVIAICVILGSCGQKGSQIPANKIVEDDTDIKNLIAINENITVREDSIVAKYVSETKKTFKKNELGFWYRTEKNGNGKSIKNNASCTIRYTLSSLQNEELESGSKEIIIGKKQTINGLEECVRLLHYGDSATIVIPWYLAYGMKGSENVKPYCSLMCKLKIQDNK